MKRATGIILIALLFLGIIVGASAMGSYNSIATKQEEVNNKYAAVDVALQRRSDLIPNLVETVKGYDIHEEQILQSISDARARISSGTPAEQVGAQNDLSAGLARLLAITEAYPELKSDANYRQLMDELAGTENRISVSRKDYNDAVERYNGLIRKFPGALYSKWFGFEAYPYLQAPEGSTAVPEVNFTNPQ